MLSCRIICTSSTTHQGDDSNERRAKFYAHYVAGILHRPRIALIPVEQVLEQLCREPALEADYLRYKYAAIGQQDMNENYRLPSTNCTLGSTTRAMTTYNCMARLVHHRH